MKKIVTIPIKTLKLLDDKGRSLGDVNAFKHLAGTLLESTPQKTDTETFICHSIREKLDAMKDGDATLELEDSEITFLQSGLSTVRSNGNLVGSSWYYVVSALQSATVEKKEAKR